MVELNDPVSHFHDAGYLAINEARLAHLADVVDGLHLPGGLTVLELGAGVGDHTDFWLSRGFTVTTSDARLVNVEALRRRFPQGDVRQIDLDADPFLDETFDVVYAYGLLYHLADPERGVRFISSATKHIAFLETCVSFGDDEQRNPVQEPSDSPSQAVTGQGCRPTRPWVFNALLRHFAFVYQPGTQPAHPQFPLDWTAPKAAAADLTRTTFVASRSPLQGVGLFPRLLAHQAVRPSGSAEHGDGLGSIIRKLGIGTVLDVGANQGQFALGLRRGEYAGLVMSFEPIPDVARALRQKAESDPFWETFEMALGAEPARRTLHVSANSFSSSFLDVEDRSTKAEPSIGYVNDIEVQVETLDRIWPSLKSRLPTGAVMLKLDVQGAERDVLAGSEAMLADVALIMAECSLVPIYKGEWLLEDLLAAMKNRGFFPVWLRPGWGNAATGQVYQCDVAFARTPDV